MTDRIKGTEEIQVELERGMQEAGRLRYQRAVDAAILRGVEAQTPYGQRLLSIHTETFANAIDAFMEEAKAKRGRRHSAIEYLQQIDSRTAAWMALREIVSRMSNPRLKMTSLGLYIGRSILTEIEMRKLRKDNKALYTGILRSTERKTQQFRKEATARFLQEKENLDVQSKNRDHCELIGVKLIEIAVEKLGIISLELEHKHSARGRKVTHERAYIVRPTMELVNWVKEGHTIFSELDPIYEPMVVPPVPWSHPLVGGYLTNEVKPLTLVKTRSKRYFRRLEKMNMPQVYEAVNRIQATPWRINHRVLEVIEQILQTNSELGGMPRNEAYELPVKPADIDTNEEAREAYRKEAYAVHQANVKLVSRCAKVQGIMRTARKYRDFEAIYFPYQLDFRGRVYPVTSLSPQGEDFVKALIEFAEGEELGTEQAADWLAIHIANLFGVDKVPFIDRVLWTHQHSDMLLAIAENPFDNREWCDADKPFQALAAAFEWQGYIEHGLAHVSRIPVALDGSCSGLQNFGMALRCEVTGKSVNLLPSDKPADIYQDVIDKVQARLIQLAGDNYAQMTPEAVINRAREACRAIYPQYKTELPFDVWLAQAVDRQYDEEGKVVKRDAETQAVYDTYWNIIAAHAWLRFGIDPATGKMSRKIAKRAVMTFPYGSKEFGFRDQLKEDIVKPDLEKNGEASPFHGCDWQAMGLMAKLLWEGVNETVVKAAEAMDWLQKAAALVAKEGQKVSWRTPLGFLVEQGYMKTDERLIETTFAGVGRIRLTVHKDTDTPDSRKQASGIAPNYVHSLDSSHLMLTVARAPDIKNWALIHDSFGTLPSRTQNLFMYVRVAFMELYTQHDVLEEFRGQILEQLDSDKLNELPPLPTKGNLDLTSVLRSGYCFA